MISSLALILAACSPKKPTPEAVPVGASVVIATTDSAAHLYRGDHQRLGTPLRMVVSDAASMDSLWRQMGLPGLPVVDFTRNQVIVAILGGETVGPAISIDTVASYDSVRFVIVRRTYPPVRCLLAQEAVEPADVVVVPRDTVRHVRFIERLTTLAGCY